MANDAAENTGEATPPRVFVSHHSSKHDVAEQVEVLLNARGIRCWIAPRDVPPGAPFDSAIQDAIKKCAAVLLLFCANSDKSRHVKRELILGDSAGRPIVPLRLEAIDPGELAYHLADSQWIDWIDRREAVMDRVAAQIRLYAGAPTSLAADVATLGDGLDAGTDATDETKRSWVVPALVAALLFAVGLAAFFAMRGTGEGEPPEAIASAEPDVEQTDAGEASADEPIEEVQPTPSPTASPPPRLITDLAPARPTPSAPPTRAPTQITASPAASEPLRRVVQACANVPTDTEYLICSNRDLGARARQMGQYIRDIRSAYEASGQSASAFNTEQRDWMNGVKARCSSAECVASAQRQRNGELQAILAELGG